MKGWNKEEAEGMLRHATALIKSALKSKNSLNKKVLIEISNETRISIVIIKEIYEQVRTEKGIRKSV